jgi:hypothetical protein
VGVIADPLSVDQKVLVRLRGPTEKNRVAESIQTTEADWRLAMNEHLVGA